MNHISMNNISIPAGAMLPMLGAIVAQVMFAAPAPELVRLGRADQLRGLGRRPGAAWQDKHGKTTGDLS